MGKGTARERDAADGRSGLPGANLGHDAMLTQIGHEQAEAAEPQIAAEDGPDPVSLGFVDGYLAVCCVVAERRHAADPETLAFGSGDLVADALRGDLTFKLG